ncbi:MAG: hypothetical protein B1H07_02825 [Campylobacteraceae bacterium 4484_166]|nr:MAG: hypothetical protein B1H07_02825 [Campylobacteraceae bacterium 4484_166]
MTPVSYLGANSFGDRELGSEGGLVRPSDSTSDKICEANSFGDRELVNFLWAVARKKEARAIR